LHETKREKGRLLFAKKEATTVPTLACAPSPSWAIVRQLFVR